MYSISSKTFSLSEVESIIEGGVKIELSEESRQAIVRCREWLEQKIEKDATPIYGITTGFGSLCNVSIDKDRLSQLQSNLVMSHACGLGDETPQDVVRLMLLFKIKSLSFGYSGVTFELVNRLIDIYNAEITPVVYTQGSLGASGDLAPLAHLSLPLIGLGEVYFKGEKISGKKMNSLMGWKPLKLKSKEGLALLNGTQFMSAYMAKAVLQTRQLSRLSDAVAALSLDAYNGLLSPFEEAVHRVRPHRGQLLTAAAIRSYLVGSDITTKVKSHVQDPYSFRCVPQVHGAVKDTLHYVESVVETEINSVTDNPTVIPEIDAVISAGNFHGEPLALVADFLAIAVSELASISTQRTYKLIGGTRGLPVYLVKNPGINSGFMIPQYTAASIVSRNKQLATPASVDSIESSLGQEDHVSMGANGAVKCLTVVENSWRVISIEMMNAAQALEFRRPERSSPILERFVAEYRKHVPFIEQDEVLYTHINASERFLKDIETQKIVML